MIIRYFLGFTAFVVPTLILGFGYKFNFFKAEYEALGMHRENISITFAFGSLFLQAAFWAYLGEKLYQKDTYIFRTIKLFLLMFPLGLSFGVFVIGAKHVMTSLFDFAILESCFTLLMYLIVTPLISWATFHKNEA